MERGLRGTRGTLSGGGGSDGFGRGWCVPDPETGPDQPESCVPDRWSVCRGQEGSRGRGSKGGVEGSSTGETN